MKDDISVSTDSPESVTCITPDLGFRVEYYLPYSVSLNQRSFNYTWSTDIRVNNFQLRVQRPSSASPLNTVPTASNVARSADGFDYHTFPRQAVAAGQPFSLQVNYTMTGTQLSAASLPSQNTGTQPTASPDTPGNGNGFNWGLAAIVGGGLLIVVALVWRQIALRRPAVENRKSVSVVYGRKAKPDNRSHLMLISGGTIPNGQSE